MENLPNEIIVKIFEFLTNDELIIQLDVCKRWNEIISETLSIMNRFPLEIRFSSINDAELLKDEIPNGNYQKLKVSATFNAKPTEIPLEILLKIFKQSAFIKEVHFININRINIISEILHILENLIHLKANYCKCIHYDKSRVTLKNLKSLEVNNHLDFIASLDTPKLEQLTISNIKATQSNYYLKEFFSSCESLKSLSITKVDEQTITILMQSAIKYEKISITDFSCNQNKIIEFLTSQGEKLKELTLKGIIDNKLINFVLEMKLHSLDIEFKYMDKDILTLDVVDNTSITKITFRLSKNLPSLNFPTLRIVKRREDDENSIFTTNPAKIISKCINLEEIYIYNSINDFQHLINNDLINVKTLKLANIPSEISLEKIYEKLKNLEIISINANDILNLNILLRKTPNLVTLKVGKLSQPSIKMDIKVFALKMLMSLEMLDVEGRIYLMKTERKFLSN